MLPGTGHENRLLCAKFRPNRDSHLNTHFFNLRIPGQLFASHRTTVYYASLNAGTHSMTRVNEDLSRFFKGVSIMELV